MIAIIGAGPVGNYVAYLLASNNIAVEVFEEHGEVGIPWQCTGITTASFEKIVELPPKLIINRLRKLKIVSRRHSVRMPIEEIVLDRVGLDKHWYEEAKKSGAKQWKASRPFFILSRTIFPPEIIIPPQLNIIQRRTKNPCATVSFRRQCRKFPSINILRLILFLNR